MKCSRLIGRIIKNNKGVALVEFALCLPLLLLLFAGCVDITRMILINQKIDKATFTVGDLVTQLNVESGVCTQINKLKTTIVQDILRPFSFTSADYRLIVSSVLRTTMNGSSNTNQYDLIEWQYTSSATKGNNSKIGTMPKGQAYKIQATLPTVLRGLKSAERLIVTEMYYVYKPLLPWKITINGMNWFDWNKQAIIYKVNYARGRVVDGNTAKGSGTLSGC